jgi:chaperonin cofactor prefoldin
MHSSSVVHENVQEEIRKLQELESENEALRLDLDNSLMDIATAEEEMDELEAENIGVYLYIYLCIYLIM